MLYVLKKQSYLFEKIKNFTFINDSEEDNDKEFEYLNDLDENNDLLSFINKIREQAEHKANETIETDRYNAFYCPELVYHLVQLAKYFPIWTEVMKEYFPLSSNVATSSRCEAYFKDLKHSDLGSNYEPMRADKFVVRHIESIESITKLEHAAIKRANKKIAIKQDNVKKRKLNCNDKRIESDTDNYSYLEEQENWKGLNTICKK